MDDALEFVDPFRPETIGAVAAQLSKKWRRIAGRRGMPLDLVDDAAQDAWVRMLERRHKVRDVTNFDAWANAIFINCMVDLIKGPGPKAERHAESLDAEDARPVASREPNPEALVLEREQRRNGVGALRTLTERERAVLVRFERDGEPAESVAALLGITPGRVRHIAMGVRRRLWEATCPGRRRPVLRGESPNPRKRARRRRLRAAARTEF